MLKNGTQEQILKALTGFTIEFAMNGPNGEAWKFDAHLKNGTFEDVQNAAAVVLGRDLDWYDVTSAKEPHLAIESRFTEGVHGHGTAFAILEGARSAYTSIRIELVPQKLSEAHGESIERYHCAMAHHSKRRRAIYDAIDAWDTVE